MADIVITAANVIAGTNANIEYVTSGATITAGQVVYLDSTDGKFKLADADATGSADAFGISLNAASNNQPLAVLKRGNLAIGGTLVAGSAYYLSGTAGGICPVTDVTTGDKVILLGVATSTTSLKLDIQNSGVVLA